MRLIKTKLDYLSQDKIVVFRINSKYISSRTIRRHSNILRVWTISRTFIMVSRKADPKHSTRSCIHQHVREFYAFIMLTYSKWFSFPWKNGVSMLCKMESITTQLRIAAKDMQNYQPYVYRNDRSHLVFPCLHERSTTHTNYPSSFKKKKTGYSVLCLCSFL